MPDLVTELSQKPQALRPEDRARLAEMLLDSIHLSADQSTEDAWDDELKRRIHEIERGDAALISAEKAFAEVRRAIQ